MIVNRDRSAGNWWRTKSFFLILITFISCQIAVNLGVYFYKVSSSLITFPARVDYNATHRGRFPSYGFIPDSGSKTKSRTVYTVRTRSSPRRVFHTNKAVSDAAASERPTRRPRFEAVTQDPVYRKRKERVEAMCQSLTGGQVKRVVEHKGTNSAYCVTPKVGCTYWLSIYRWLHNDTWGKVYRNPLDMPRQNVHDILTLTNMKYLTFKQSNAPASLNKRFKFMFVREPYHRLWSAYVDKFLLPDLWHIDGDLILRYVRDKQRTGMTPALKRNVTQKATRDRSKRSVGKNDVNQTSLSLQWNLFQIKNKIFTVLDQNLGFNQSENTSRETKTHKRRGSKNQDIASCTDNITFTDFLDYITSADPRTMNEHYRPYHYLCSPCAFPPDLIGKMETFENDTRTVLQQLNMTWINEKSPAEDERPLREISLLTEYNFDEIKRVKYFRGCINNTQVAVRLWKAFQINGYIPRNLSFPLRQDRDVKMTTFRKLAMTTYTMSRIASGKFGKKQKTAAFLEAYRQVPDHLIERVRKTFDLDFKFFDYDPYPPALYHYRKVGPSGS